jgi:hypothetical protein
MSTLSGGWGGCRFSRSVFGYLVESHTQSPGLAADSSTASGKSAMRIKSGHSFLFILSKYQKQEKRTFFYFAETRCLVLSGIPRRLIC